MKGLWAGIPFLLLIVGALLTKRIIESAVISSIVAVAMLDGVHFISAYIEKMYAVLTNPSFQLLILAAVGFAGLSGILEKSGAMFGFQKMLEKICKTKKSTGFFTWLLGWLIFIDDYLNALAVSASMKGISDENNIPREHLAYTINCMGACVCVMIPVSSWSAFAIGCMTEQNLNFEVYLRAIPFMFYPIAAILLSLLLTQEKFPLLGRLKQAYIRVETGGPVLDADHQCLKRPDQKIHSSSYLNFLLPMAALVAGVVLFEQDILAGILCAAAVLFILMLTQHLMKVTEFFDTFLENGTTMTPLLIIIFFVFVMEMSADEMGFTTAISGLLCRAVPAWLIPALTFLSTAGITFFAASFWAMIVIAFPIFLPMAAQAGVDPSVIIGAVMSGVALGSQACLYSDAIFMVGAGTDVPNDVQFKIALPYVGIGVLLASAAFLLTGIFH